MTRLDIAAPVHRYIDVDGVRVYQLRPGPGLSDGVCNGPDLKVRDHRECPRRRRRSCVISSPPGSDLPTNGPHGWSKDMGYGARCALDPWDSGG